MDRLMTLAEIREAFDSEWVLVEDPETSEGLRLSRGLVRCHSKDRDEVYRHAIALRPRRFAVIYTGTIPENTAVVL
jgi:hypothetical protein